MAQRILAFESDAGFAKELDRGFRNLGVQIDIVSDGNEGIERAQVQPPDLILLSIELPTMNGFLVCKRLKKHPELKDVPLIILSNDANADEIFEQHRKLRTRAEDYVRKPVSFQNLVSRVKELLPIVDPSPNAGEPEVHLEDVDPSELTVSAAHVDDEIEAFAESAFDSLVVEDEEIPVTQTTVDRPGSDKTSRPPRKKTDIEPTAEVLRPQILAAEMVGVDETVATNDSSLLHELSEAKQRAEAAERELAELKSRPLKPTGVSSREFLDLREALNRKDKEILELKDQVTAREKQVLELRDKNLVLERSAADYEDKIGELEGSLAESRQQSQALSQDKETATKRADDLRTRLERAEARFAKLEQDLEGERDAHGAEVQRLKQERETLEVQFQRQQAELSDRHSAERAELAAQHAAQAEKLREENAAALQRAEAARREEIETLKALHAADRARLEDEAQSALNRTMAEHSSTLASLEERHLSELALRANQALEEKEAALQQQRLELETLMQRRLEAAESEHRTFLANTRQELESAHNAALQNLSDKHNKELAVLGRKLADAETASNELRAALDGANESIRALEGHLLARTEERDSTRTELANTHELVRSLQKQLEGKNDQISRLEGQQRALEEKLAGLVRKIETDSELLDRVRKAVAIGLSLLEDQKNNHADEHGAIQRSS